MPRADDAFCCLGTTIKTAGSREAFRAVDFDATFAFAQAARAAGAARFFLVSSSGASARSRVFYSRVKGEIEDAVARLPFEAVVLLRPSLLLGERAQARLGERLGEPLLALAAPLLVGPLRKYRAIEAGVVAKAALALAREGGKGRRVVESDELQRLGG